MKEGFYVTAVNVTLGIYFKAVSSLSKYEHFLAIWMKKTSLENAKNSSSQKFVKYLVVKSYRAKSDILWFLYGVYAFLPWKRCESAKFYCLSF